MTLFRSPRKIEGRYILFVTFEGIDGSGKSTQTELLAACLEQAGFACLRSFQPGASSLGSAIRSLILNSPQAPCALSEALLFMADRAQHIQECLRPALDEGKIVLCDRYTDSSLAYQGYGSGQDIDTIRQLNDIATGGLRPHLTLLFDLPPQAALARIAPANRMSDRFEREGFAYHERVRAGYLELAKAAPERFVIIDAMRAKEEIFADVKSVCLGRLEGVHG
ncbi:MAG: dTMP kinase [Spirochaetota bacterium]|nr:dTMP kinase [Spirochaetota bacterium]